MNVRLAILIVLVALGVGFVAGRMSGPESGSMTGPGPVRPEEPAAEVPHPAVVADDGSSAETPAPPPAEEDPGDAVVRHIDRIVTDPPSPPDAIPDLYIGSLIHTPNGDLKIVGSGGAYRLVRHGHWVSLHPSGEKACEEEYVEGVRSGPAVHWHEGGVVRMRGSHAEGRRVGVWQEFDGKGNLSVETDFDAGVIVSVRRWGSDGSLLTDAALEERATCGGRYRGLLHRFHVPGDAQRYGMFKDYGHYKETDYQDVKAVPAAYWVFVHPYWFVWAEKVE